MSAHCSSQSWSSLVDKSALEGIPPMERRRQEVTSLVINPGRQINVHSQAMFELITTENGYVRDLQLVVEVRMNVPMAISLIQSYM